MVADEQDVIRGGGKALAFGGVLFVVATVLHPSQETPARILELEARLVASHAVYIVASLLILLGLPGLYLAELRRTGRLGSIGFLVAWLGTALLAISSQFGFLAPPLAATAPAILDHLNMYPPVVVFNAIAAVAFMGGYAVLGIVFSRSPVFSGWSGLLVGLGAPAYLIGAGIALVAAPRLWPIAVVGAAALGAGLALCGNRIGRRAAPVEGASGGQAEVRLKALYSSWHHPRLMTLAAPSHRPGKGLSRELGGHLVIPHASVDEGRPVADQTTPQAVADAPRRQESRACHGDDAEPRKQVSQQTPQGKGGFDCSCRRPDRSGCCV